ncbi:MAG: hypothetical protein JNL57_06795 [Bacteroidetes bacterium]|nr:hypothetical protein [Bacteroidota bacterium]
MLFFTPSIFCEPQPLAGQSLDIAVNDRFKSAAEFKERLYPRYANGISKRNDDEFYEKSLRDRICSISQEYKGNDEDIPNELAISNFVNTTKQFNKSLIYLMELRITVEEGLYSSYIFRKNYILHCEFYNSGEIAYILENTINNSITSKNDYTNYQNLIQDIIG